MKFSARIWNSFYPWPVSAIGQLQERWTHWLYRDALFWTPSESTKKILQAHGVKNIHVFQNGTDATPLAALEPKPIKAPLRLVTVSRLAPNKSAWITAIKALKILLDKNTDVRLAIVGTWRNGKRCAETNRERAWGRRAR